MPYVDEKARERLNDGSIPKKAGELNYSITRMIWSYILLKGESYQTYNDIMGALEGVKLELYRRKIAPYEDLKKEANGDVY